MKAFLESLKHGAKPDFPAFVAALGGVLPLLSQLSETPQEPQWHGEGDVGTHTDLVLRAVYDVAERQGVEGDERLALVLAAALHDIGKALTTRRAEDASGRERLISPRHADRGRSYLAYRLPELELPWSAIHTVLALVGHHHDLGRTLDAGTQAAYRRLARQADPRLLYLLEAADIRGRVAADRADKLELVELFRLGAEEFGVWTDPQPYAAWQVAIEAELSGFPSAYRDLVVQQGILDFEASVISTPHEALARGYAAREGFPHLIVTCGPSGSGKSAWVEGHWPEAEVVSLDLWRERLAGKRADQSVNGRVLQAAKEQLKAALRIKRTVVWDATNTRRDFRNIPLRLGFEYGALTTLAVFQPPLSTLFERNPLRIHPVPVPVVAAQIEHAEFPYLPEAHRTLRLDQFGRETRTAGFGSAVVVTG